MMICSKYTKQKKLCCQNCSISNAFIYFFKSYGRAFEDIQLSIYKPIQAATNSWLGRSVRHTIEVTFDLSVSGQQHRTKVTADFVLSSTLENVAPSNMTFQQNNG